MSPSATTLPLALLALATLSATAAEVADFTRAEGWRADAGSVATARCEGGAEGIAISFQDTPGKDACSFRRRCDTDIAGMRGLRLRVRTMKGGWLTWTVTIDGRERELRSAHPGDGQWRELAVPIDGARLDEIRLALDEPAANGLAVMSERIRLEAAWLRIERDAPIDEASGADLLAGAADGGFEEAERDGRTGRGWRPNHWRSEAMEYGVVEDRPHGGKRCQRLHVRESGVLTGISSAKLPLSPGGRYEMKGWLRGQGLTTPRVAIEVAKADVPWEEKVKNIYLTTTVEVGREWTPFACEFTLPTAAAGEEVLGVMTTVWMDNNDLIKNHGTLWLDDVSVTRLPDISKRPGNLLFNGDLELGIAGWRTSIIAWNSLRQLPEAMKIPPTIVADAASGKQALRIEVPYGEDIKVRVDVDSLPFRAVAGEPVTVSWYAKAEGGQPAGALQQGFGIRPKSGSGMGEKDRGTAGTLTAQWQRFSATVTLAEDVEGIYRVRIPLEIAPAANRPTVIWVDGMQVEYGSQLSPVGPDAPITAACATPPGEPEDRLYQRAQKPGVRIASQCAAAAQAPWTVVDVWGQRVAEGVLTLPAGIATQTLALPAPALGSFKFALRPPGSVASAKPMAEHVYHILPRLPKPGFQPDSPFGLHLGQSDYSLTLANKLGARWIRLFGALTWNALEPAPGRWFIDDAKTTLERYAANTLMVMPVLTGVPGRCALPAEHGASHVPVDDRALATWIDALAKLDGPALGAWEVWNEPNLGDEFKAPKGVDKKLAYIDFSKRMYAQLRARSRKPVVNQLTAANFEDGWISDMLGRGFAAHADQISYHNYLGQSDPLEIGLDRLVAAWTAAMKATGKVAPLVMSEGGICGTGAVATWYDRLPKYVSGSVLDEAVLNVRTMVANLGLGVERVFLYHAGGDGPAWGEIGTWDFWGAFLEGDGVPKPSCTAYAVMTWQLEGRRFVRKLRPDPRSWCHVFTGSSGTVAVCWSDDGEARPVTIPVAGKSAVDLMGNPVPLEAKGETTTLTFGRAPVYVLLR